MNTLFSVHLIFVCLSLILSAYRIGGCSLSGAPCQENEDCCSIPNGRSYCNGQSRRCEALRYCDKSSLNGCPFNDLSPNEIKNIVQLIKDYNRLGTNLQFPIVRKQEPNKKEWNAGNKTAFERIAYAAVFDIDRNRLWEVLVSLTKQTVVSATYRPDSVPPVTSYENDIAAKIAFADSRVIYAYETRGLNVSYAQCDTWGFGARRNAQGKRQVTIIFNYQDPETKYMDWCPVEGLIVTVDIASKKIIEFTDMDTKRNIPVPKTPLPAPSDHEMPPEDITVQSDASPSPSIEVDGFNVKWENWKFQYSFDPIHGLQLYHIRYLADCEERFLIYKISISEMFVPYGASGSTWRWRGAFDAGEYGLGTNASPMMMGVDVPPNAQMLSCTRLDDTSGEVSEMENCIAIYERLVRPVYYHYDADRDIHDAKSGTELVVMFMCTVGNYDYIWEYVFATDGTIMAMVMATGILLSRAVINKKNHPNCVEDCHDYVHDNVIAPLHQHYVNYRIDFDVDGASNMFMQVDFVRDPVSSDNHDGGAFSLQRKIIPKESFLDSSPSNARFWTMINTQSRNDFNTPRGYSIHPLSTTPTFLTNGSPLSQAQFIKYPIWVTAYNDDEQCAAGDFPRSGKANQGLPEYIRDATSLRNVDIVMWHSLGFSHAPRPEEYPLMNKHVAGFHLMPRNFMSANPLIKVRCNNGDQDHIRDHLAMQKDLPL